MFSEAINLIAARLKDNWTTTPIDFDNVKYRPTIGVSWVRLQVQWVDTTVVGMGGRTRGEGYIDLSVFAPPNSGDYAVNVLADSLAALFNKYVSGALRCRIARTQRIGEFESWYQMKVIIPFEYDTCN